MSTSEKVLELRSVTKRFGPKLILDNVSLIVNRRDRIGLIGENGAGKTTLVRILIGELAADSGLCLPAPAVTVGYLPQAIALNAGKTVRHVVAGATGELEALAQELSRLEAAIAAPDLPSEHLNTLLDQYADAQEAFTRLGGYESDYRIAQIFAGLGLSPIDLDRPIDTLSGGEQTRVAVAGLLLSSPAVLILDEPTNHLDFAALDWLEAYLLDYAGALLIVSHDRQFLNTVIDRIVELSEATHQLTSYAGNYEFYLAEHARAQIKQRQLFEAQQTERELLERLIKLKTHNVQRTKAAPDNDKFLAHFRQAQSEKGHSRTIANAKQRLDAIDDQPVAEPDDRRWTINPDFAPDELSSQEAIRLVDLSKAIDGRVLFSGLTATIERRAHIVLYGPNGVGKTTLLKVILGLTTPDSGLVTVARGVRIGYLDQAIEQLDPRQTVLDAYRQALSGQESEHRAALHRYGLFSGDQVQQPVGSLSWGQQRKLQLARLIAQHANVLLLDEPTNHLDLASVEQIEQALIAFPGVILAVSHDRTFIDRVGQTRWTLRDGRLISGE